MHSGQYCEVLDRTILDATSVIRYALAYTQFKNKSLYILSLDFEAAFEKLILDFCRLLEVYNYDDFLQVIQAMYDLTFSYV
jgi:hypothetical protein